MRQVLSFLPQRLGPVLKLICIFTFTSGTWLGLMDLRLRHPGYLQREWIAGLIVGQAAMTLLVLGRRGPGWLRFVALAGCVGILSLAAHALVGVVTGANFEGYILLIALALVVQAALTVLIVPRIDRPHRAPGVKPALSSIRTLCDRNFAGLFVETKCVNINTIP